MHELSARILSARRKRPFGTSPLFEPYRPVTEPDLVKLERELGCELPTGLRAWLLAAGYGDINERLSFRKEWFSSIDLGELEGHVIFARDDLGNFYSFAPSGEAVHYICRSAPEFALMATDFSAFLHEPEQRSFELEPWAGSQCFHLPLGRLTPPLGPTRDALSALQISMSRQAEFLATVRGANRGDIRLCPPARTPRQARRSAPSHF